LRSQADALRFLVRKEGRLGVHLDGGTLVDVLALGWMRLKTNPVIAEDDCGGAVRRTVARGWRNCRVGRAAQ
jgi:hypothetical protein